MKFSECSILAWTPCSSYKFFFWLQAADLLEVNLLTEVPLLYSSRFRGLQRDRGRSAASKSTEQRRPLFSSSSSSNMNATQISSHHDEKNHHATILFWIEGVGVASVGVLGLCVNLFAIWKLSFGLRNKERHAFHHLLLSLSICDLTHVLLTFTCFSLPQLSNAYRSKVLFYMLPFVIPLAQMSLSCSSFTTVVSKSGENEIRDILLNVSSQV